MTFIKYLWASVLALALLNAAPATAQERTGARPGFTLAPGTVRIVLMRPSIRVGAQSTGGMFEPNADWTAQARENLTQALRQAQATLGNELVVYDEGSSGEGPLMNQYSSLFGSLADAVIEYQFFRGNRLPTKVRNAGFDWSLGPGLSNRASLQGADYALFINTQDAYGSTGRRILQVVALLGGIPVTAGVHVGHAGLVDLRTGELVWLNADRSMGGDVRTPEGAARRVQQLLEGFPGRPTQTTSEGR